MAEKDYISREAFLDAIERGKKYQQDADDIAEMLQNFPAADVRPVVRKPVAEVAQPRWIPVTERLPDTPGEYMVAYHPCYWDRVHDEIKVGLDSFRGKTSWAKKKYQRVTHWMPLPEPPKEE